MFRIFIICGSFAIVTFLLFWGVIWIVDCLSNSRLSSFIRQWFVPHSMRGKFAVIIAVIAALFIASRPLLNLFCIGHLHYPTTADYENIAKAGQPVLQAICDYRSDHGSLPQTLDDIVPAYLPQKPEGWDYDKNNCLSHRAGFPHTYVLYWFEGGEANEWRLRGEGGNYRLDVPGPTIKKIKAP